MPTAATPSPPSSSTSRRRAPTSRSSTSNGRSSARADFTPFITAQMGKKPDAVFCDVFGGDFVTLAKQAAPLGYFKAINNRLVDGGEVGTTDAALALGKDYPYGIWSDAYDPVIWPENEPAAHKAYIEHLKAFTKQEYASGWAIMGYASILALKAGIEKAEQHQVRRGGEGDARAHLRHADRQAHLQRQDPRDRDGRVLGPDGEGRPLSLRHHEGPQVSLAGAVHAVTALIEAVPG